MPSPVEPYFKGTLGILSRLNLKIFGQPNKQTREIPEENAFDGRQSTGADTYRQATKALDRNVDGCEECLGFPRK